MEDARDRVGRLAYVTYEFPVLTQTFTRAEVAGLSAQGFDLQVIACRPSRDTGVASSEDEPFAVKVLPSAPVGALLHWLVRRPVRTLGLVGRIAFARYRDQAWRCRLRGFRQLMQGAALASQVRGRGVHLHAQFVDAASTVAWVAARLSDTTFSVTNHTAYNPYLLREKLRDAARFFCISDFDRAGTLEAAGRREAPNLRVIRQGVDLSRYRFRGERPRSGAGRLLSVGALREKKGHHVLIRAAAILRDRQIDARLTIVGEGPERERLEALVAELGLEDRVELAGAEPPDRIRGHLAGADVFVLACTTARNGDLDGIPVSLMEAMAQGVPVISTRLSGIPELIEDGRTGRLVAPDDADGLADAIAAALADPEAVAREAERARNVVEDHHDVRETVRRLAAELRDVMDEGAA